MFVQSTLLSLQTSPLNIFIQVQLNMKNNTFIKNILCDLKFFKFRKQTQRLLVTGIEKIFIRADQTNIDPHHIISGVILQQLKGNKSILSRVLFPWYQLQEIVAIKYQSHHSRMCFERPSHFNRFENIFGKKIIFEPKICLVSLPLNLAVNFHHYGKQLFHTFT